MRHHRNQHVTAVDVCGPLDGKRWRTDRRIRRYSSQRGDIAHRNVDLLARVDDKIDRVGSRRYTSMLIRVGVVSPRTISSVTGKPV
jgi:hypothetical protein